MAPTPRELLAAWDSQQTAFIEFRAQRTRCLVDVVAALAARVGRAVRVLDLGCGPGSLTNAVLARLPGAVAVGVDRDPVLLRLFRETTPFADRIDIVDADLRSPDWADHLPPGRFDAAVSATALHWLEPPQLVTLYRQLAGVLTPGGVVLNADHLLFDTATESFVGSVAVSERERVRRRLVDEGARTWEAWWAEAFAMPGWEEEIAEQHRRWSDKHTVTPSSASFHLAALRCAGFTETAQIWQWLDDRIVYGRMPDGPDPGPDAGPDTGPGAAVSGASG